MQNYSLAHVDDAVLLRELFALVAQDRLTTAMLLAHIAEVDTRRLYVPAGYSSMHGYCVDELRLSEDAACDRIAVAVADAAVERHAQEVLVRTELLVGHHAVLAGDD